MSGTLARAPGRVNLIGEHTDYNGGFVLPCAISRFTQAHFVASGANEISVHSAFGTAQFPAGKQNTRGFGDWRDYIRGVLSELHAIAGTLPGGTLTIESTVPAGAGLSSSASLEVAVALALLRAKNMRTQRLEVAKLAQRAENGYTGARSGLMDQLTVLFAQEGCALLIDTKELQLRSIRVPDSIAIVICNTMKTHAIARGGYNDRRAECEEAAELLGVDDLVDGDLALAQQTLPPGLLRRARHVIDEDGRVLEAADALEHEQMERFGALMYASHESLRTDFEVSTQELDLLVEIARDLGALGARLTGGGFGGCTVNVVRKDRARSFSEELARRYAERTGVAPEIYDGTPAGAASVHAA